MKNQITFLILLIVLSLSSLQAQVSEEWVQRYNGPENSDDYAYSLAVDESGNVYITGRSNGSGTGSDYLTIKYNPLGVQQWIQRYDGPGGIGYDYARSLTVDGSGNVYVTGSSPGSETNIDYATIKYNSSGVQQWVQRYNGPGSGIDRAYSVSVDQSGNVYVTGYSSGIETGYDYATIKYNSSGVLQWIQRYDRPAGNNGDYALSLAVDGSGNVYVTGYSQGIGTDNHYVTIKYNSSGDQQWIQKHGPGVGIANYERLLAVDGSGNVYVTVGINGNGADYATIKYNSSGIQQWIKIYNGSGNHNDIPYSLAVDDLGNVYVTGYSSNGAGIDYATIKYNSSGVQQWVQRYNGPENLWDETLSMAIDGSGNVYLTGSSIGIGNNSDYATIKYNSSGVQQWVKRYHGDRNGSDFASSIAVDGSGSIYVTGYSSGIETGYDYATIKYSQTVGISQTSNSIPEEFSLSQNFPNPFNPVTNLEFGIPKWGFVSLKIYNMLGKEIATLVNDNLNPGKYNYNFDASALPTGVYFYKLQTDHFSEVKKMTLIK